MAKATFAATKNYQESIDKKTFVIAPAATLFWFLVKSLARIQMPARRPPT